MKEISPLLADVTPELRPSNPGSLDVRNRHLTAREHEILRLLALGLGTSAIARGLSISTATVRNHVQRILAKLRVHSRLAAVARGYAIGILSSPASEDLTKADRETPPS